MLHQRYLLEVPMTGSLASMTMCRNHRQYPNEHLGPQSQSCILRVEEVPGINKPLPPPQVYSGLHQRFGWSRGPRKADGDLEGG